MQVGNTDKAPSRQSDEFTGDTSSLVTTGVQNPEERAARRRKIQIWAGRLLLLVVIIGSWQYFGPKIGPITASSPLALYHALQKLAASGTLWTDLAATMEEVVGGYLIGSVAGTVLGALASVNRFVAGLLDPFIVGLYGIPKIAFGPLLVVWLGIGLMPKVTLAAMMAFFVVFFATYQGLRDVDPNMVQAVRLMGASAYQIRRYVTFPGARSSIFLGLKLAVPEALVGAIVGEFISSSEGIGYQIQFATTQLDTAGVFAGLLILAVLSLALNAIVNKASGVPAGQVH